MHLLKLTFYSLVVANTCTANTNNVFKYIVLENNFPITLNAVICLQRYPWEFPFLTCTYVKKEYLIHERKKQACYENI